MYEEGAIVDQAADRHKRPWDLTDTEVFQLMQAYTADKTCITEADALTLCHWAEHHKRSAHILGLVLAGHLRVTVAGQDVQLGPQRCARQEAP